jgi:acetyl-CoA carboxylase biotin carboxyl carrier protein
MTMDHERTQTAGDGNARRTIASLTAETLPRLIERLMRSELGELEVRENGWRIRLRRANGVSGATDSQPGESRDRGRLSSVSASTGHQERAVGQRGVSVRRAESDRGVVTSPAVGYFVAREGVSVGSRVRQGDVIGQVDVLGVAQEVVAPVDGAIGSFEVEPGQAIEFGQPVARVEVAGSRTRGTTDAEEEAPGVLVEA